MPIMDDKAVDKVEEMYPGIGEQIRRFEEVKLPPCPNCKSENTASIQIGIIGRTINIAGATSKVHLRPNGKPGKYYCNSCKQYFI